MTATATLPPTDTCCSLCDLPAPFCPCDRRDIFTTPNTPLRVEHFTLTDDGRFVATQDDDEYRQVLEEERAEARYDADEPEEYEPSPYDGTYSED